MPPIHMDPHLYSLTVNTTAVMEFIHYKFDHNEWRNSKRALEELLGPESRNGSA